MSVKIITDSTSYLPKNLREDFDIEVVSLNVILDEVSHRELDLSNHTFYDQMAHAKDLPSSSQPIPEEMLLAFEHALSQGYEVLGIFLSSQMSGTFQSSHLIKEMALEKYPNGRIELLDSKSNCMQMGFAVLEAAKVAQKNGTLEECVKAAEFVIEHSQFLFTPETLDYLKKGGRIGGASALLANLLQIRPILTVRNGVTEVFTKVRTQKKALSTMVDALLNTYKPDEIGNVVVHHINCEERGRALAQTLETYLDFPVDVVSIGPVIGLHVGPGSLGIVFHKKNKA